MALLNVPIPSISEATQNAARNLQQSLADAIQAADPASLTARDLELARSNVEALSFVQGVGLHGAYRYLRDFIARQAVPIWSVGEMLDGWLKSYGLPRKQQAAATGTVSGTGLDGTLLTAQTLMQVGGVQYVVLSDVAVAGGVVTANVQAVLPGIAGNQVPGAVLTLVSAVDGIDPTFTADLVSGLSGGAATETDEEAVYRLQQRLANEPMGGCPADYARWALTIASITRAWGVRNPAGPTSAGVIIMADGNVPYGVPTLAQAGQVADYILDPRRGPPDELFVIRPTPVVKNFTLSVTPDTAATRAAVLAAMKDLFFREAVPGGSIPHNHVTETISGVTGEYNHSITSPAMVSGALFTVASFDQLLVLGTVTFI